MFDELASRNGIDFTGRNTDDLEGEWPGFRPPSRGRECFDWSKPRVDIVCDSLLAASVLVEEGLPLLISCTSDWPLLRGRGVVSAIFVVRNRLTKL